MKKTYEKPKLIALSLSGNNRLCGDCAGKITLSDNPSIADAILMLAGRNDEIDGVPGLSKGDFEGLFGQEDQCKGARIEAYCKFTSVNQVAWS